MSNEHETYWHLKEGKVKKGGLNPPPKSPRPNVTPGARGVRHCQCCNPPEPKKSSES